MLKKIFTNPFILFPVLALLFFWPFSLLFLSLKNDALTYYYPVRTLIADALNNGELPLWTPFINMGYPLHADLQSAAWNPVVWTFAFLTKYSLAAFHYELLFYISFAGIGFYFFCRDLNCRKAAAIIAASAYMFSGFITDSVQFFPCISSACYLPFIFLYFRRMMQHFRNKDSLLFAFFLYLLFTGGYPSLFIICVYLLAAYALFFFFLSDNKKQFARHAFIKTGIAFFIFFLLSLPAIISFIHQLPLMERGKSLALNTVLENSMHPASMLSMLFPFGTTAPDKWLNASILMRSMFIGILPLIFLILAFTNREINKNREMIFFLTCALLLLGMAWGEFFFLRKLAYFGIPLMDSFRHPALFRLFSIFLLLIITAVSISRWMAAPAAHRQSMLKVIRATGILLIIMGVLCIFFTSNIFLPIGYGAAALKNHLQQMNFFDRCAVQLPFSAALFLAAYYTLLKRKSIALLVFICLADLFITVQLCFPITIAGAKSFKEVETLINRNPEAFPLPSQNSVEWNSANSYNENIITGSTLPFLKKIGRNDYFISPGNLYRQDSFYNAPMRTVVFKNPVAYFADSLITWQNSDTSANRGIAYNNNPLVYVNTGIPAEKDSIHFISLSANLVELITVKQTPGLLVLQQNAYPGWEATVDGADAPIISVNISFMGIPVPEGRHKLAFHYRPTTVIAAWYVSIIVHALLLLYLLFTFSIQIKGKHRKENV